MTANEEILEEQKHSETTKHETLYIFGKKYDTSKVHRKFRRKPRIIGAIITNLFIIIGVIIIILILFT